MSSIVQQNIQFSPVCSTLQLVTDTVKPKTKLLQNCMRFACDFTFVLFRFRRTCGHRYRWP